MSMNELELEWKDLLFGVKCSVRYNERRRLFFERWHRMTSAVSVLFGSAAVVSLLQKYDPSVTATAAIIVTVFSTVDLVVGTGRQAWLHADLTRSFITLEQEMNNAKVTSGNLKKFRTERLDIEKDEPPVKHVVNILSHNDLLVAEGYDRSELYNVGPVMKLLANFIDLNHHSIIKYKDSPLV